MEKATFAMGCFWGVEATFRKVPGVKNATVGYTGGTTKDPGYEAVCTGKTGHAEAVQLEFDPAKVSYADLLKVFWENHNPTTLDRQGPDHGSQYRSSIFFHTAAQQAEAQASQRILEKAGVFKSKIVTEIKPAPEFYAAEEYHQRYLEKNGLDHCSI